MRRTPYIGHVIHVNGMRSGHVTEGGSGSGGVHHSGHQLGRNGAMATAPATSHAIRLGPRAGRRGLTAFMLALSNVEAL